MTSDDEAQTEPLMVRLAPHLHSSPGHHQSSPHQKLTRSLVRSNYALILSLSLFFLLGITLLLGGPHKKRGARDSTGQFRPEAEAALQGPPPEWCAYGTLSGYWVDAAQAHRRHWQVLEPGCRLRDMLGIVAVPGSGKLIERFNLLNDSASRPGSTVADQAVPAVQAAASEKAEHLTTGAAQVVDGANANATQAKPTLTEADARSARILFLSDSVDRYILTYLCEIIAGEVVMADVSAFQPPASTTPSPEPPTTKPATTANDTTTAEAQAAAQQASAQQASSQATTGTQAASQASSSSQGTAGAAQQGGESAAAGVTKHGTHEHNTHVQQHEHAKSLDGQGHTAGQHTAGSTADTHQRTKSHADANSTSTATAAGATAQQQQQQEAGTKGSGHTRRLHQQAETAASITTHSSLLLGESERAMSRQQGAASSGTVIVPRRNLGADAWGPGAGGTGTGPARRKRARGGAFRSTQSQGTQLSTQQEQGGGTGAQQGGTTQQGEGTAAGGGGGSQGGSTTTTPGHYQPNMCVNSPQTHIHLMSTYIPGVHPTGPYHRNMRKGWEQQLSDVKALWHQNVSSEFAPDIIVIGSCLWDLARLSAYERDTVSGKELPRAFIDSWVANFTALVQGVRAAMPHTAMLAFHTTMMPRFDPYSGLMEKPHLGRRFYVSQMNAAGRMAATLMGLEVIDYAALATRFAEGQTYLIDSVHPGPEVGLEISNILLNYVHLLRHKQFEDPEWHHPSMWKDRSHTMTDGRTDATAATAAP